MPSYRKNFLENVSFRIDFADTAIAPNSEYIERLKGLYPTHRQNEASESFVNINVGGGELQQSQRTYTVWTFSSEDEAKRLVVGPKWLSLEYPKYKNSATLLEDVRGAFDTFVEAYQLRVLERASLRFSNVIKLSDQNPLEWSNYINPDLLGNVKFARSNSTPVARAMSQLIIKGVTSNTAFNYGIWNRDFPNEVSRKEFVLDYEQFTNFAFSPIESRPSALAQSFEENIKQLFEKSIGQELRRMLS
jgi:uncharacterized protein (TIGR04255 family)